MVELNSTSSMSSATLLDGASRPRGLDKRSTSSCTTICDRGQDDPSEKALGAGTGAIDDEEKPALRLVDEVGLGGDESLAVRAATDPTLEPIVEGMGEFSKTRRWSLLLVFSLAMVRWLLILSLVFPAR